MSEKEEQVGQHYDDAIFEYEVMRSKFCPVEFEITARQLERRIPDRAIVAEIGVGGGFYSELLARRGCFLHLVDVSARLLDTAWSKLRVNGFQDQIIGIDRASATNLDCLQTSKFDAMLMLGPLYHLCQLDERQRAVSEAARALKPGGLLFAAGINRLAYLRDLFRESPREVLARREFHEQYLSNGNLDPRHAPPIGFAHLTTIAEFRALFANEFEEMGLLGIESFVSVWQKSLIELQEEESSAWMDLIDQTATMPEALGMSDHFLFIGRKKSGGGTT
ncbi:MAG: class I SAM-dependent methyltransferase [Acidobacteria bacterium]|nr:class I SAM-dependent methyltransferase [Acidobacteriota bacterium]MCI0663207.1 class I SAM-dependent methyltransferase [Acidobacteriota bacterium]